VERFETGLRANVDREPPDGRLVFHDQYANRHQGLQNARALKYPYLHSLKFSYNKSVKNGRIADAAGTYT
jgi:hypothetical protein